MKNLFAGSNYSAQHWSLFCCEEDYCRSVASSRKSTNRRRSAAFTNCKTAFTPFVRQIKMLKISLLSEDCDVSKFSWTWLKVVCYKMVCKLERKYCLEICVIIWTRLYFPLFDAGCCAGWQTGLESGRHPWRLSDWAGRKCGTSREPRHHLQTQKRCGGGALSCWVTSTVCCKVGLLFQLKDSKALRGTLRGFLGSFPNIQV